MTVQRLRSEKKKKLSDQVDAQTANQTALHPLTPGEDGSGSTKVEKVQWKEWALEVLKLGFFFLRNKENGTKETARVVVGGAAVGRKEEHKLIC